MLLLSFGLYRLQSTSYSYRRRVYYQLIKAVNLIKCDIHHNSRSNEEEEEEVKKKQSLVRGANSLLTPTKQQGGDSDIA